MRPWLGFLAWSTVLGPACWLISPSYQQWLAALVRTASDLLGHRVRVHDLEVYAPVEIGVFAAMCLATSGATLAQRVRATLLGIPTLISLEVVILLIASLPVMLGLHPSEGGEILGSLADYFVKTIVWVNAGVVWTILLAGKVDSALWQRPAEAKPRHHFRRQGRTGREHTDTSGAGTR
jgi:hypothetical protein